MALAGARPPKQHAGTRAPARAPADHHALAEDLRWLRRRARSLVRSDELARDLVQDTFLAWFERPPSLRAGLRPWLEGVLRNQLRMSTRTSVRRERREAETHLPEQVHTPATPEGLLDRAQLASVIERELDALPEPYRETLRLRYWDNLRAVEIAERLGVPQSTVRRRNLVGLGMLRERLERRLGGRDELDGTLVRAFALPWLAGLRRGAAAVARTWRAPLAAAGVVTLLAAGAVIDRRGAVPDRDVAHATARSSSSALGPFGRASGVVGAWAAAASPLGTTAAAPPELGRDDAPRASQDGGGCGPSVQARIDAARPWSTVRLPAGCTFRETVRIDEPIVIEAEPGAELRGSDVWSAFRRAADVWVSEASVPAFAAQACQPTPPGENTDDEVCAPFELVFVDGVRLPRAEGRRPRPGEWALDEHRRVVLAAAPEGHLVEVTVRPTVLAIGSSDVVVRGLVVRHAMGGPRTGAIEVKGALHDVRFEGVRAFDAGGPLLVLNAEGRDHTFTDGELAGAGGPAVLAVSSTRLTIARSHLRGNGLAHRLDNGWVTGGVKVEFGSVDLDGNLIDGNRGEAVLCAGCFDSHIHGNTLRDNLGAGVIMLLSHRSVVDRNRSWHNGFGFAPARPAMFVVQSTGVRVAENVLAFHEAGIAVLPLDLDDLPEGYDACAASRDNAVDGNVIVADDAPVRVSGDPRPARLLAPCSTEHVTSNGVWSARSANVVPDAVRRGVRPLTDRERDELLARYGIPGLAAL